MPTPKRQMFASQAALLVAGMTVVGTPTAAAQQGATGFPIGIHSGNCQDPLTEPAYDAGSAEPIGTDDAIVQGAADAHPGPDRGDHGDGGCGA